MRSIDAAGPRLGRVKGNNRIPPRISSWWPWDTGGQHVRATNDIAGAMRRVTEGMRDYYRLTYSPTNTALDGRFRAITVKVRDPEAVVTARNGYLAGPRAATPMVAPYDVAPHVVLDAEKLPTDFTLTCAARLASSGIEVDGQRQGRCARLHGAARRRRLRGGGHPAGARPGKGRPRAGRLQRDVLAQRRSRATRLGPGTGSCGSPRRCRGRARRRWK